MDAPIAVAIARAHRDLCVLAGLPDDPTHEARARSVLASVEGPTMAGVERAVSASRERVIQGSAVPSPADIVWLARQLS